MDDFIELLPKERWTGYSLPMHYTADSYTDVRVERDEADFTVTFRKRPLDAPVEHRPDEEYDCPDKLYAPYWEDAEAWGVVRDGELLAAIEFCPETWSNRLRVTELWVTEDLRGQGVGRALMDLAKERGQTGPPEGGHPGNPILQQQRLGILSASGIYPDRIRCLLLYERRSGAAGGPDGAGLVSGERTPINKKGRASAGLFSFDYASVSCCQVCAAALETALIAGSG